MHDDDTITWEGLLEYVDYLKENNIKEVEFQLVKCKKYTKTYYKHLRASFNQVWLIFWYGKKLNLSILIK